MTTGIPMSEIVRECRACDFSHFVRNHGEAFLLYAGTRDELKDTAREWQLTEPTHGRRAGQDLEGNLTRVRVYPMPDSTLSPWTVTLGRVADNEVVLNDETVSTYHAAFSRGPDGTFLVRDADSSGGTFLNEVLVSQRPVRVGTGDLLRFGAVVLTFMLPADIYHLARNLASLVSAGVPPRRQLHSTELFGDLTPGTTGAHPLSPTVPMTIEAVQLIEEGHYERAQALLTDVLAVDPTSRSARLWIEIAKGRAHTAASETGAAIRCYEAVLALDEHHPEALRQLALLRVARRGRR